MVIGKALLVDPSVHLFADPTGGIDVGTKYEIHVLMRKLAAQGRGILLIAALGIPYATRTLRQRREATA
ncbi:hypothetical protein [Kineococcus arenarius]|uniref:hypothetical protein n=1 Tax=Kineococcus sp. SYSU DK021 TaxID=3383142 RepID=UPI003D7E90B3